MYLKFELFLKCGAYCVFSEEYDAYIIVSFVNATLVLSIGETVEEVTDSGFLGTTPTLSCSQLGDDALVQVVWAWYYPIVDIQVVWSLTFKGSLLCVYKIVIKVSVFRTGDSKTHFYLLKI